MARFSIDEAKNYGGGNSNFLSLKNDRDVVRVRFLINTINDLYGVSCHEIEDNGNRVDVECLRTYDEPVDKCPLCQAGYKVLPKLFIPIYNEKEQKSQIWTRGKTYFDKMAGFCSRFNPLVGTPFEIERHGKSGDTNTTYEIYSGVPDNKRLSDFPQIELEGTAFQVKTYDELNNFLDTGSFEQPIQRQTTRAQESYRQIPVRRAPTNEEDKF